MRYLVDTNVFLWWLNDDKRLKEVVSREISDPKNEIYVSLVTAWEMSIKHRIGKLPLMASIEKCFEKSEFGLLAITLEHIFGLDKLKFFHKDPFDRMLVAQVQVEKMTLITADKKLRKYAVKLLLV